MGDPNGFVFFSTFFSAFLVFDRDSALLLRVLEPELLEELPEEEEREEDEELAELERERERLELPEVLPEEELMGGAGMEKRHINMHAI